MEKHRWYDVIIAWASGKQIQFRPITDDPPVYSWWDVDMNAADSPNFNLRHYEWRIKPEEEEEEEEEVEEFIAISNAGGPDGQYDNFEL